MSSTGNKSSTAASSAAASGSPKDTGTQRDAGHHDQEPQALPMTQSIYSTFSPTRRALILAVVSTSQFLNPFTSSIILPSLKALQLVFNTSSIVASAIIAVYYFPLGVASLFWGPACDMWGRKIVYLASTGLYAAATVGCIFPNSIHMLLGFRAVQGIALGAYRSAGIGCIADVYPPEQRGLAIGILMLSTLVGPIIGPILGGFLAQAYGWRAPFITLLVFAAGVIIPLVALLVPETHQYKTMQRLVKRDPDAAVRLKEAQQILAHPPRFRSPWTPIVVVFERDIVLHLLVGLIGFAALVSVQTEIPGLLGSAPYNLSPGMIGLSYVPTGVAGFIAAPLGGRIFDRAAATNPGHPMLRLSYNNLLSLVGMPSGLLLFGWAAHFHVHLAAVIIGLFIVGASMSIYLPPFMGYLSCVKQHLASTASAGQNALIFMASGTLVITGSALTGTLGIGWYCTIMAVLHLLFAVAAQLQIIRTRKASRQ